MSSLRASLETLLARLATVGADPGDDDDTRLRKALLVLIAVLILPIGMLWGRPLRRVRHLDRAPGFRLRRDLGDRDPPLRPRP
jgi:hypothetical protein